MRVIALMLPLLVLFAHPAQAVDCKPRSLSEYFECQKVQEAERVLKVFGAAGEASSYWPCLRSELTAAGKEAQAKSDQIDTAEEYDQVIIDAQVACEAHFPAFETALHKELDDAGYDDDIESSEQLQFYVYQLWATFLPELASQ
jgi:hypothetical protein